MLEYLLIFPEREDAEDVAEELREEETFTSVRVVQEALAGEDDAESHEWAVYVSLDTIDDITSAPAQALLERFTGLAQDHEGWLDERV
ncbi:hypothetical protein V3G39_04205 [Dermatophilaceae bacterium Sec6.4]|nr:hypothetical protein [Actinomycetota bacterium]